MAKVLLRVAGIDGQIALLPDRIVIRRDGLWNAMRYGFNSQREIPIGAIAEVAFRDAGMLTFGEIEFIRAGRSIDEKQGSQNSVVHFGKKHQQQFEALKEKVFDLMEQLNKQRQQQT